MPKRKAVLTTDVAPNASCTVEVKRLARCYGKVEWDTPTKATIYIDPRQNPKELLDTLIHEALHFYAPNWSEEAVKSATKGIAALLWRAGYRKLAPDQDPSTDE